MDYDAKLKMFLDKLVGSGYKIVSIGDVAPEDDLHQHWLEYKLSYSTPVDTKDNRSVCDMLFGYPRPLERAYGHFAQPL